MFYNRQNTSCKWWSLTKNKKICNFYNFKNSNDLIGILVVTILEHSSTKIANPNWPLEPKGKFSFRKICQKFCHFGSRYEKNWEKIFQNMEKSLIWDWTAEIYFWAAGWPPLFQYIIPINDVIYLVQKHQRIQIKNKTKTVPNYPAPRYNSKNSNQNFIERNNVTKQILNLICINNN
jgi:hypothetical protein